MFQVSVSVKIGLATKPDKMGQVTPHFKLSLSQTVDSCQLTSQITRLAVSLQNTWHGEEQKNQVSDLENHGPSGAVSCTVYSHSCQPATTFHKKEERIKQSNSRPLQTAFIMGSCHFRGHRCFGHLSACQHMAG